MPTESMSAEPHAPHRLLCPQSVALIGASEKSARSHITIARAKADIGAQSECCSIGGTGRHHRRHWDAAVALGAGLESLEVNPLRVGEHGVEALDAVAVWKEVQRKA